MNPTTMIKCTFANAVHKILEPNFTLKFKDRWKNKKDLTDADKLKMFEQIMQLHNECSQQLRSYQFDKKGKKKIQKARIERGYVPKKKTKKEDYEKMVKTV